MNFLSEYIAALNPATGQAVADFYGNPSTITRGEDGSVAYGTTQSNPYAAISPYRYSGMRSKDMPADRLYADLIRAQTRDYQNRFAPVENFLAGEITATGTKSLPGDLARTRAAVMGAGQNIQGQQNRQMERYGLAGTSNIGQSNSQISALVGGMNDTRMRDVDRRNAILSGGLSGVTQKARNLGS